jgi:uncharacterized protein (DUF58 family)
MHKKDLITELCAVIAFSSLQNNDKIGLIFFSDKIEKFIPPKKGRTHVLRIIRELIDFKPESTGTDLSVALKYAINAIKKRSIVFILSDFLSEDFEEPLKIISKKHDTIAVHIYDKREAEIPNVGLINVQDAETGEILTFDTSDYNIRKNYMSRWEDEQNALHTLLKKNSIDTINLRTDESYIRPLINFFKKRGSRVG